MVASHPSPVGVEVAVEVVAHQGPADVVVALVVDKFLPKTWMVWLLTQWSDLAEYSDGVAE